VDSTELVEIAVAIERNTPVALDTEEVLALKTVGDLVSYVHNAPPREQATAPQPG
jgi:acyl carrier protein